MTVTRRQVIRSGSLASLAAATSVLPWAPDWAQCSTSAKWVAGIRVFLEGSWLFLANPTITDPNTPKDLWAVTVNMPTAPHKFQYGAWPGSIKAWQNITSELTANNASQSNPATITLSTPPAKPVPATAGQLFSQAQEYGPFAFIKNPNPFTNKPYQFDATGIDVRVVSLPMPTRIIPSAIRAEASLDNFSTYCNKPPAGAPSLGVAASYIFEYVGAHGLKFSLDNNINLPKSTDFNGSFHIHTVTPKDYGAMHGQQMFAALLQLISPPLSKVLLFDAPTTGTPPSPTLGTCVPTGTDPSEIGIPPASMPMQTEHTDIGGPRAFTVTFPTCGGGSGGVGG